MKGWRDGRIIKTYPHPTHLLQCDGGKEPDYHVQSLSSGFT